MIVCYAQEKGDFMKITRKEAIELAQKILRDAERARLESYQREAEMDRAFEDDDDIDPERDPQYLTSP